MGGQAAGGYRVDAATSGDGKWNYLVLELYLLCPLAWLISFLDALCSLTTGLPTKRIFPQLFSAKVASLKLSTPLHR